MRRNQQTPNQSSGLHTRSNPSSTVDPRYPNGARGGFARTGKFNETNQTRDVSLEETGNRQTDRFRSSTRPGGAQQACHCSHGPSTRTGQANLTQTGGRPGYDGYTTTGGRPGYDGFKTGSRGSPTTRTFHSLAKTREAEEQPPPLPGPPGRPGQHPSPCGGRVARPGKGPRCHCHCGHKFPRRHGCFGCHFHPKISHVFNPKKFSDSYNPWSANMWGQDFQKPGQSASTGTKPTRPSQTGSSAQKPTRPSYQRPPQPSIGTEVPPAQQQQVVEQQPVVDQTAVEEPYEEEEVLTQEEQQQEEIEQEQLQEEADDLFQFASIEEFQELRHHATEASALTQLRELATDITGQSPSNISPAAASCLICCNSYTKPSYQLGVGPINDAITVAANHKVQGFTVYFVHNPKAADFLKVLQVFFKNVTHYLTVYYTGHGSQVTDTHGDEDDNKDEVMVFDDGYITDDELLKCIKDYHTGKPQTILMSDCCHSGTIWDIPTDITAASKLPANILSLSAADDTQTAKQTTLEQNCQGCFTYYFWTLVRNNPSITPDEIEEILNKSLKKFTQQLVMIPTRADLLQSPMFPLLNR